MRGRSAFLVNDTSVSGHPGCVTVMSVIKDSLEARGITVSGRWPMGAEPQFGLELSPALRQAHVVVVNGEGTLHNTAARPGARRLLHAIKRIRGATSAPIFLINATIENLRSRDFSVLQHCERLFLRDTRSCRYAEANGLSAVIASDLCFSARLGPAMKGEGKVVTDSTLPEVSRLLRRQAIVYEATFLPMQRSRFKSMMRWTVTPGAHERSAIRYFSSIAAAQSVVTGRFHAAVFSLMSETPFLAVRSNTAKIESLLLEALGTPERLIQTGDLQRQTLLVPPLSNDEINRIRRYRRDAIARANKMFDHIAQSAAMMSRQIAS